MIRAGFPIRTTAGLRRLGLSVLAMAALAGGFSAPSTARAGIMTQPVKVVSIRVYDAGAGAVAFVQLDSTSTCNTNLFQIELFKLSGAGMLAVANTAMTTQKYVIAEISNANGCAGYGTILQSLAINA
ncbi:hypothetical protein DMC25_24660 [Caulobacter sp. D4A]|uniref:hypothetical protein n=1 Tax=unclassified Caulobacter TaxID=2648921 RepID=UPI000D72A75F|nr:MULTISPECIES: hypothetical protein [unclassified Caulobacter]PXA75356.1 hypothetical protein DMC25_24660 [Caulobacter sp. D4A]PXA91257.1 hypothetical protein DMC18_13480 [Caulobacter sp. D5]